LEEAAMEGPPLQMALTVRHQSLDTATTLMPLGPLVERVELDIARQTLLVGQLLPRQAT